MAEVLVTCGRGAIPRTAASFSPAPLLDRGTIMVKSHHESWGQLRAQFENLPNRRRKVAP